jgi:hypothetical protein
MKLRKRGIFLIGATPLVAAGYMLFLASKNLETDFFEILNIQVHYLLGHHQTTASIRRGIPYQLRRLRLWST